MKPSLAEILTLTCGSGIKSMFPLEPITTELAWRLRRERGLELPTDREYADPRVHEIACRQYELRRELEKLDKELETLAS